MGVWAVYALTNQAELFNSQPSKNSIVIAGL